MIVKAQLVDVNGTIVSETTYMEWDLVDGLSISKGEFSDV
jgi:hypothetical protein